MYPFRHAKMVHSCFVPETGGDPVSRQRPYVEGADVIAVRTDYDVECTSKYISVSRHRGARHLKHIKHAVKLSVAHACSPCGFLCTVQNICRQTCFSSQNSSCPMEDNTMEVHNSYLREAEASRAGGTAIFDVIILMYCRQGDPGTQSFWPLCTSKTGMSL
jgi:hypothetical protein